MFTADAWKTLFSAKALVPTRTTRDFLPPAGARSAVSMIANAPDLSPDCGEKGGCRGVTTRNAALDVTATGVVVTSAVAVESMVVVSGKKDTRLERSFTIGELP